MPAGSDGSLWYGPVDNPPNGDLLSHDRLNQKTTFIGTSAPATTFAGQIWFDSTNNILYIRNKDNNAWILKMDQSVDTGASPTFVGLIVTTVTGSPHIIDVGTTYDLVIASDSTTAFTADRILTVDLDNVARTLKMQNNLTVEAGAPAASIINQDLTTDASPTFANILLGTGTIQFTNGTNTETLSWGKYGLHLDFVGPDAGAFVIGNKGELFYDSGVNGFGFDTYDFDPSITFWVKSNLMHIGQYFSSPLISMDIYGNLISVGYLQGKLGIITDYLSGDYGLTWTQTMPTGINGMIIVVYNSNAGVLASRLYVYSNSGWHYTALI
jgi:hypothetical protein